MDGNIPDSESVKKHGLENGKVHNEKADTEDKLSQVMGELGRWQIFLIAILAIPCKMSAIWQMLGIIFLAPKTQYRCISRNNSSADILNMTCYSNCDSYEYVTEFEDSIITQFELICDRAWLPNMTQMLYMFGVLIGSMVIGFMADRYGRRKAILLSSMMQLILSLILPLSPEYWSFTVIRFFLGVSTAGIMVVSFVLIIEITGPSKRELVASLYHIPLAVGEMTMPLIAYYLRTWKMFSLGIGLPNLLFLMYIFLVPESPRWLISQGRLEEASIIMHRGAKYNKLPTHNALEAAQAMAKESRSNNDKEQQTKVSYFDLITNSSIRVKNLCSCISWFILGLSFYGGNQYIGQTSSNVFYTMVLAGGLQIPGMLSSGYFIKRFGRRKTVVGFLLVNAICNSLLAMPDDWFYLKMFAGAIGVSCAAGAFTAMYSFTSELFPTVARNMAMGVSSTASRVGSMLAPFVAGMVGQAWLPPLIFAVAPLVAAGVCCCLPETKGRKLLETLEAD